MGAEELGMQMDGGYLPLISPTASNEEQIAMLNQVITRLNNSLKTQIYSDSVSKRLLIGYQENGWGVGKDFGMKMSIEGVDVTQATDEELLFSMSIDNWTWRNENGELVKTFRNNEGIDSYYNSDGSVVKEFKNETGTDSYYDPTGRNYINAGLRPRGTYGFEMAKPSEDLGNEPS